METTILVADDDSIIRSLLESSLSGRGYQVLSADDGLESLRLASEHPIDLFVLDHDMPEIKGLDVFYFLREDEKYADTPFIIITSNFGVLEILRREEFPGTAYFEKPFDMDEFHTAVEGLLQQ